MPTPHFFATYLLGFAQVFGHACISKHGMPTPHFFATYLLGLILHRFLVIG
jgi:hypothetical protein